MRGSNQSRSGFILLSALVMLVVLSIVLMMSLAGSKVRFFTLKHLDLKNDVSALRRFVKGSLDCAQTIGTNPCPSTGYYTNFNNRNGASLAAGPAAGQIGSFLLRWSCDTQQMVIQYAKISGVASDGTLIFARDPLTRQVLDWRPLFDQSANAPPVCTLVSSAGAGGTGSYYSVVTVPLIDKKTPCQVGSSYTGETWQADVSCPDGPPQYTRPVQGMSGCQFKDSGGNLITSYPDPTDAKGLRWHVECCSTQGAMPGPIPSPGFASLSCMRILPPWLKVTGDLKAQSASPGQISCMPWRAGGGTTLTARVLCPAGLDPITPKGDKPALAAIGGGATCPMGGYLLNSQSEVEQTSSGYAYAWRTDCCVPGNVAAGTAFASAAWAVCSASPDATN